MVRELVVLMAVLWLQLRLYSTGNMLKRIDATINSTPPRPLPAGWQAIDFARRCDQLAAIAAYHGFYHATCLPRSLAVYRVLGAYRVPARLRIGVLPGSNPLQAHAWVECGAEILGDQDIGFQPFFALNKKEGIG